MFVTGNIILEEFTGKKCKEMVRPHPRTRHVHIETMCTLKQKRKREKQAGFGVHLYWLGADSGHVCTGHRVRRTARCGSRALPRCSTR